MSVRKGLRKALSVQPVAKRLHISRSRTRRARTILPSLTHGTRGPSPCPLLPDAARTAPGARPGAP
eukprot:scaffold8150_cov116-Isochrysis_galbana.AAC.9